MRFGDPLLDHPSLVYEDSEAGLHWYLNLTEPWEFEGFSIDLPISYGYQDDKLTAILFKVNLPRYNESEHSYYFIKDLLTERYGDYELLESYHGGRCLYKWETNDVYAVIHVWDYTTDVIVCTYEFGVTVLGPGFGIRN